MPQFLTRFLVWKMHFRWLFLATLLVISFADDDDEPAARLFIYKSTKTSPVVEGKNFSISYHVINNGDAAASKIDIADRYDPNSFELKENVNEDGSVLFSVDELSPGAETFFNVTVEPKLFGIYESTRARVRYATGLHIEDVEDDIRSGYSTSLGRIKIISAAEFIRSSSLWLKEWAVFAILIGAAIFLPLFRWLSAKTENQKISTKRKSN